MPRLVRPGDQKATAAQPLAVLGERVEQDRQPLDRMDSRKKQHDAGGVIDAVPLAEP